MQNLIERSATPSWSRRRSRPGRLGKGTLLTLAALVALRGAMPWMVRQYVNRVLGRLKGYRGSIADVDILLVRGMYRIERPALRKLVNGVYLPFFSARYVDFSVDWKGLLRGTVVGRVVIEGAVIELTAEEGPAKPPPPGGRFDMRPLRDQLRRLLPVRIDRFEVRNGFVRYRNPSTKPPIDLRIGDIQLLATNLTNSEKVSRSLVASLTARARMFGEGRAQLDARVNPMTASPTFDLDASLRGVPVTELNDFLRTYGEFDAEAGTLSLDVEAAAAHGYVKGYAKPVFDGLKIMRWGEKRKDAGNAFWEALVAATAQVLQNQPKDRLAARIPFEGPIEHAEVGVGSAIVSVLKNAFIHALVPRQEHSIRLKFRNPKRTRP